MAQKLQNGYQILSHGGIGNREKNYNLTGSCHELRVALQGEIYRILVDMGGYQWPGKLDRNLDEILEWKNHGHPRVEAVVFTHWHMDHIGDALHLTRHSVGKILASSRTRDIIKIALEDAIKIAETDYEVKQSNFQSYVKKTLSNAVQTVKEYENGGIKRNANGDRMATTIEERNRDIHYQEAKKILEKENEINSYKIQLENQIKENTKLEKDYNDELNFKKNEIIRLENIEKTLTAENTKLEKEKRELEEKDKENSKKMEIFMKKFEEKENELKSIGSLLEAKKIYDKYLSIETRILSKLDNVLIQRDFESFISSGYTLSSLDNVWDIVKIEYKNISNEDKEILKEVFSFFLNQINKRFKEAKYGLVQVEVGEDFDAVNQVDLSQNSRGRVTECVFYGYGFLAEKENPNEEDVVTRIIKSPLVLTA